MILTEFLGKEPFRKAENGSLGPFFTDDYIGVEVELENIDLPRLSSGAPRVSPPSGWMYHLDGSLRNNGLEFLFNSPANGLNIAARLESLIDFIKKNKLKPDCSARTSVHVHIDAGDCTVEQLFKWCLIYAVYEPMLFAVYAPERVTSNFCVPLFDSHELRSLISTLRDSKWQNVFQELKGIVSERKRYAALNMDAIMKFGSLEFRHHGGAYKPKPIIDWINTLLALKAWAMRPDSSEMNLFTGPSKMYAKEVTSNIFPYEIGLKLTQYPDFDTLYLKGIRTAQEMYLDRAIPAMPEKAFQKLSILKNERKKKNLEKIKKFIEKSSTPQLDRDSFDDSLYIYNDSIAELSHIPVADPTFLRDPFAQVQGGEQLTIPTRPVPRRAPRARRPITSRVFQDVNTFSNWRELGADQIFNSFRAVTESVQTNPDGPPTDIRREIPLSDDELLEIIREIQPRHEDESSEPDEL